MPENFSIQARNANNLPITNPQDTRSEEGYLKNLTVEATLEVLSGGEIKNEDGDYTIDENGLSLKIVSESLVAGPNKLKWKAVDGTPYVDFYSVFEFNTEPFPPPDNSETYVILDILQGNTRMFLIRNMSVEIGKKLFVLSEDNSFSKDTGSIITEGGIGIEKNAYVGKDLSIGGSFFINGKHELNTSVSTTYTVASSVSSVLVNDSSALGATITLPSGELGFGRVIFVKDITGSAGAASIVIQRQGSDTIDGTTSISLTTSYQGVQLINTKPNVWSVVDIAVSSGGSGTVTSIATNNGITGGTITATGTIGLTGQALALHNLATNGIIARTGSGTVAARTITAGTGISISNGDGVSGNPTITALNNGTVTSVGGTGTVSGLTLSGTVTTSGNLTLGGTLSVTASNFASQTANTFLAAPNGSAGTPTFRAIVASDVPTLNQNTTGNALSIKANNTSGVLQVTGPANSTTRVMTTPDANFTVARTDAAQTFTGTQTFSSTISGSITGNAATVTNGVYTTGNQSISGTKTFEPGITVGTGSALAADTGIVFSYQATGGGASSLKLIGPELISVGGTQIRLPASSGTVALTSQIPTVNNGTLTLATSGIATGSASFTANQSGGSTFTVNVPATNIAQGTRTTTTVPITSSTGTGATLNVATTSLAGVMSSADKTKLDGIAANANNYTHPNHTGDVTSTGDGATTIATNAVTATKFRQSASMSVVGHPTTGGNVEDIQAGTDHQVLRRSGTTIAFGSIALNQSAAITGTLPVGNGGTGATTFTGVVIGNGGSAMSAVAGTAGQLLRRNAGNTAYEFFSPTYISGNQTITLSGDVTGSGTTAITTTIANNAVTLAKIASIANNTILGNNSGVATNPIALTASQIRTILNVADGATANTGTVTSVSGTGTVSGLTLSGTVTTSGSITLGGTLAVTPANFASQTAKTVLIAPNASAGVPTFRALVATDVPTLNQNTTGSAATLTTTRTLWGQNFNGSANVTGALSSVTTLSMSGQLTNTVAVGTAPFVITSTTRVTNLNVATAGTADTFTTARNINGVSFNGSANITVTANTPNSLTFNNSGTGAASGSTFNGGSAVTVSHNTIGAPSTTGSGASGTWGISVTGNAGTVTNGVYTTGNQSISGTKTFEPGITVGTGSTLPSSAGIVFSYQASGPVASSLRLIAPEVSAVGGTEVRLPASSGTLALTSQLPTVNNGTLTLAVSGVGLSGSASFTANQSGGSTFTVTSNATSANTASTIVARNASGNFTAGTITAALSGNASTATTLQTARNIGGTSFNGSSNIEIIQIKANNSSGVLQVTGPANSTTRVMTVPDSNFSVVPKTAGDAGNGFVDYNSTTRVAGKFYGGTTNPTSTTRLNYDGALHATAGVLSGLALIPKFMDDAEVTYTATTENAIIFCSDSVGNGQTITLPASPKDGQILIIKDVATMFGTVNATIARNGKLINEVAANITTSGDNSMWIFIYCNATGSWYTQTIFSI